MQHRLIILVGAGLVAILLAVSLPIVWAQEAFPPASPGGYLPNGQFQNGYNPVTGSQPLVVPSQPTVPIRPDTFPGGLTPPIASGGGNPPAVASFGAAPAYGPMYQTGPAPAPRVANPASYPGQQFQPGFSGQPVPPAPMQLCSGAQVIGRVGNDVVLTSDILTSIDDLMAGAKGKMPADKFAEQRAAIVKETTEAINELNAHCNDPDPAKSMMPAQKALLTQLLRKQIDVKLLFQDFRKTVPKEALPGIEDNIKRVFDETQQKVLMKREDVVSVSDLESKLRSKGSSLDREKRIFSEQVIAQQWVQQKVKPEAEEKEEVTHEEMLAWYQAHIKDFEKPARARWEELMISFSRHANRDEAYAAVAALGNRVLAGASLADVAKSGSEGATAPKGGLNDWIHPDSLSSESLNQAIFSLPVGQLSQILESNVGFHIVRVVEREERSRTSFLDAQKEIKESIKKERYEKRYKEFVDKLHAKYPIWTIFDNATQQPQNADDEDRYSKR